MTDLARRASDRLVAGRIEPRFDIDYEFGRQGELQIGDLLDAIAKGDGRVEIKTKRIIDAVFYVEQEHDPGRRGYYKPSGISTTDAAMWAYVIADTDVYVWFPTELLRRMMNEPSSKPATCDRGSCPTRGKLVNLGATLCRLKRDRDRQRGH